VIRVLLADDQALVRGALAAMLGLESDIDVVAQVGSGADVVPTALVTRPDVALLDVQMPGGDGLDAAAALHAALPSCRAVILTTFGRPGYLARAMRAGAAGFVVKDAPPEQLIVAVRRMHAGLRVVDPSLAAESLSSGTSPLTDRERDVLLAAADGATVAAVAGRLHLSGAPSATTSRRRSARPRRGPGPRPCGWPTTAAGSDTGTPGFCRIPGVLSVSTLRGADSRDREAAMVGTVCPSPSHPSAPGTELVALVAGARAGDAESWRLLVARFQGPLLHAASTWRLDSAATSDLVQQTWVTAYTHLGELRDDGAFGGWLRMILRRECLQETRRRRRESPSEDVDTDGRRRVLFCGEPALPESVLLRTEDEQLLAAARARLPRRDQDLLAVIADLPYAQISHRLGIPVGSIGPTRGRCFTRLRHELQKLGMERC